MTLSIMFYIQWTPFFSFFSQTKDPRDQMELQCYFIAQKYLVMPVRTQARSSQFRKKEICRLTQLNYHFAKHFLVEQNLLLGSNKEDSDDKTIT